MKKYFESGRSMVEMLGTLAIIGVLSIGGIAGYKYGMDKYKANQTMNDIMLMGVDIITQLSQQRTQAPVLSSDYGTKTTAGYDFTVVQNPEDETQYGIQITGVPTSICKQVGDGLKQTVAVYVGNEDYNSDTETDPCDESDNNTMEFYFDKNIILNDNVDESDSNPRTETTMETTQTVVVYNTEPYSARLGCTSNADCGECAYCRTDSWANDCVSYLQSDNMPCDGGRGLCADRGGNQSVCVIPGTCSTNSDCNSYGSNYYCGMVTNDTWSLEVTNNYQCTKLSFINLEINGHDVFVSTRTILLGYGEFYNSTSAQNACARMDMNVVNPTVLCENYTPSGWQEGVCAGAFIVCSKENIQ
ncbi:MAG: hypothetical protein IKL32_05970 [Alphaproteobacteria bacterium]|nr:hypothetical protein [Alphaproteobacteria bacterium]